MKLKNVSKEFENRFMLQLFLKDLTQYKQFQTKTDEQTM